MEADADGRAMIDIHALLAGLSRQRPLFHSEADFQHAFAWELHLQWPDATVRLERPIQTGLGLLHVDLLADLGNALLAVELKYKTRRVETTLGTERFHLQNHGAQPVSRYAFLKDIARLESLSATPAATRWAVLLTNDSAYWSKPGKADGTSAAFSLTEGRACSGVLEWGAATSAGTKGKSESPIKLAGQYQFAWRDYATVEAARDARFRYLAVEVR